MKWRILGGGAGLYVVGGLAWYIWASTTGRHPTVVSAAVWPWELYTALRDQNSTPPSDRDASGQRIIPGASTRPPPSAIDFSDVTGGSSTVYPN